MSEVKSYIFVNGFSKNAGRICYTCEKCSHKWIYETTSGECPQCFGEGLPKHTLSQELSAQLVKANTYRKKARWIIGISALILCLLFFCPLVSGLDIYTYANFSVSAWDIANVGYVGTSQQKRNILAYSFLLIPAILLIQSSRISEKIRRELPENQYERLKVVWRAIPESYFKNLRGASIAGLAVISVFVYASTSRFVSLWGGIEGFQQAYAFGYIKFTIFTWLIMLIYIGLIVFAQICHVKWLKNENQGINKQK